MKNKLFIILFCSLILPNVFAQEAIHEHRPKGSPLINSDGTVTFTLWAPEAQKVVLMGDFLQRPTQMSVKDGLWTFTTSNSLSPELYSYRYYVDGVEVLDPANLNRSRDVRSFMSTFIISCGKGDCGYLYSPQTVPHGTIHQLWYPSPALSMNRRLTVYTPAQYEEGGRYPVLYLLHGSGGDEEAWITLGRTAQILDNLIALGKAEPMIVVMPNGNSNQEGSPFVQTQRIGKPKASFPESFPDVMKFMKKNFRIRSGKKNTAICGLSMGGYHTFAISNSLPGTFNYIGLFSAALRMDDFKNRDICSYLKETPGMADKIKMVFDAKPQLYWIAIGKNDFLYDHNEGLRKYLDQMGYPYEYHESEGGHTWRNWRLYLTAFAQRLFK